MIRFNLHYRFDSLFANCNTNNCASSIRMLKRDVAYVKGEIVGLLAVSNTFSKTNRAAEIALRTSINANVEIARSTG